MSEVTAEVEFRGGFDKAFATGDNSSVLPTHTMTNTVTALFPEYLSRPLEEFASDLAAHFLGACPAVRTVRVHMTERPWTPLRTVDGAPSPHSYGLAGPQLDTATATADRDGETVVSGGITDLWLSKTTGSSFTGFLRDEFTTKAEQYDRPMEVKFSIDWEFRPGARDCSASRVTVRDTVLRVFEEHQSLSSQHTLHVLGSAVVEACPELARVRLTCLAHDHPLLDLSPFGRRNTNQVYAASRIPCSLTRLTVEGAPAERPAELCAVAAEQAG